MKALEEESTLLFCHTEEIWIRNGRRVNAMNKHAKHGGDIFEHCLPLCCVSPSSVLIHRDIFDVVGNFDESLPACEDYDLWLRICSRYDVLFIEEALITKYGGHEDQLSKEHWGMDRFRITALEKIMNAPYLSFAQRKLAMETLMTKLRIFLLGAKKRGRDDAMTQAYEKQVHHWERYTPQAELHG
jgi:GT2 family glycosyltransferase